MAQSEFLGRLGSWAKYQELFGSTDTVASATRKERANVKWDLIPHTVNDEIMRGHHISNPKTCQHVKNCHSYKNLCELS